MIDGSDRICTHILAEGDSEVYYFSDSFIEYEENKKEETFSGDLTQNV
jgi:hypothetical protein